MLFIPLGATDTIGASCHYLNVDGTGILLDAGVDPDSEGLASLPRLEILDENPGWTVDHVVITHAHHDHLGSLPVLIKRYPRLCVHMTGATRELAEILLPASARLQRRKQQEGTSAHAPLFDEEEVRVVDFIYSTYELNQPFDLTGGSGDTEISGTFFNSGHILGSVGVEIVAKRKAKPVRIFYSSDTNLRHQSIIPGGEYPAPGLDVLIMESTMGADDDATTTTRASEEEKLGKAIQRVISRGGAVLIPAFALGRAQEVVALIDRYKSAGLVPDDVPVYTTGSMRAIAGLYDRTRLTTPRIDPEFEVFGVQQKRHPRSTEGTRASVRKPSIHIAASGMMFQNTLSNRLAQYMLSNENNGIFFVGFAREDSPGGALLEAAENGKKVVLNKERGPQKIKCEIGQFRLSGHSHRDDLLELAESLDPLKTILVHGELEAREWLAGRIREGTSDQQVLLPTVGQPIHF
ncbi:MAG: MBL fold metallo-hydrolase [Rhodothermales bacterium]|nr:MBL fold metallo-hydrolase [Rhodothermales bacterium]